MNPFLPGSASTCPFLLLLPFPHPFTQFVSLPRSVHRVRRIPSPPFLFVVVVVFVVLVAPWTFMISVGRVMTYRSRFEPHISRLLGNRKDRWVFSVLWWAMNLRWIEIGTGGERERVIERVNLIESLDKSLQYLANWRSTLGHSCKIYTNGACGTNERTLFS